ncbi:E3 ubiquitin-protein ligase TRAIP isoform X2 [Diabrotica virgifera virgifera]|uniref:RING-type domain-containing protein n=1 Tax=Diabrotica virgifera virgifera TaxID=50390 RepID=A0ABM5K489_DIAVI|nr:E3 ubiquitin-protein ligase TRAIP isoform X2 [Diabrotica virgifera virgifera]
MNFTCVICSELFITGADVYFTQCGHVFHFPCLMNWLERSKSCPQCRGRVTEKTIHKVFFNVGNVDITEDSATLLFKLENANFAMTLKEKEIKNLQESKQKLKGQNQKLREEVIKLENNERNFQSTMLAFKSQISFFKKKSKETDNLAEEIEKLKSKLKTMEHLETAIEGTREQVYGILKDERDAEALAILAASLKKALLISEKKARDFEFNLKRAKNEINKQKKEKAIQDGEMATLRREIQQLKMKYDREKDILRRRLNTLGNANQNNIVVANPDADSESLLSHDNNSSHHENEKSCNQEDTSLANTTMSVAERVQEIVNTSSPYLPIKSNYGNLLGTAFQGPNSVLSSTSSASNVDKLAERGETAKSNYGHLLETVYDGQYASNKPSSTCTNKGYSIFKTSQKSLVDGTKKSKHDDNVDYDGLGGTNKTEIFPSSKRQQTGMKRTKSASSLSSSKFKKLAPLGSAAKLTQFFPNNQ